MKSLIGSALFLVLAAFSVSAGEVEVDRMVDCPPDRGNDPSLIVRHAVSPRSTCEADAGRFRTMYSMVDERYGIVYWVGVPSFVPLMKEVQTPEEKDVADTMKVCLNIFPRGDVIDEWIVPTSMSCEGRFSGSASWRRYVRGRKSQKLCLMPQDTCIRLDELEPVAQERARRAMGRANGQYASRTR